MIRPPPCPFRLKRLPYPTITAPKEIGTDENGHPVAWTTGTLGDLDLTDALVRLSGPKTFGGGAKVAIEEGFARLSFTEWFAF